MTTLADLFEDLLGKIEPDAEAVSHASQAHVFVREYLEKDSALKAHIRGSFLYGSYKRRTAVGDIKDVDIVIMTDYDIAQHTPHQILRRLKSSLAICYKDPENPEYQRRSIRVNEPLPRHKNIELTLDIIPAVLVTTEDQRLRVPDRETKSWIWSHPKGHIEATSNLNRKNKQFVPLVKLIKWWWKYQCEVKQPDVARPKPKGFWLECLTAESFDSSQSDMAGHFIAVLRTIANKYADAKKVPELKDPGLADEVIKTSMTFKEFEVFIGSVRDSLDLAVKASAATDVVEGSELWRDVFGDSFPLFDPEDTPEARAKSAVIPIGDASHAQQLPWPERLDKRYKVRLDAYLYSNLTKLGGVNSDTRVIQSGLRLMYVARTKARGNFDVFWQVVNTGPHAARSNGLRGEFFQAKLPGGTLSDDPLVNWESTLYTGKHWIECFIVKDNVCVGRSGKFKIAVKNPDY